MPQRTNTTIARKIILTLSFRSLTELSCCENCVTFEPQLVPLQIHISRIFSGFSKLSAVLGLSCSCPLCYRRLLLSMPGKCCPARVIVSLGTYRGKTQQSQHRRWLRPASYGSQLYANRISIARCSALLLPEQ